VLVSSASEVKISHSHSSVARLLISFKFVINPDYKSPETHHPNGNNHNFNIRDPDTLVSWNAVDEVLVPVTVDGTGVEEGNQCPICLDCPPSLAMITKCGHTFWYAPFHLSYCSLYF